MALDSRDPITSVFSSLLASSGPPHWRPSADIYRAPGGGWLIKLDLAGVHPDAVEIVIGKSQLIVRGDRRDWAFHESYQQQSLEISYSRFERRFELPETPRANEILTEFWHGMLLIRIEPRRRKAEGGRP